MGSHLEISQAFAEDAVDGRLDRVSEHESVVLSTTETAVANSRPMLQSHTISDVDLAMHLLGVADIAHTNGDVDHAKHFVELAYELLDGACSVNRRH